MQRTTIRSYAAVIELHQKLVKAAVRTHVKTSLNICSQTGIAKGAMEEIELLQKAVSSSAFT
jgi:hypothetical protein